MLLFGAWGIVLMKTKGSITTRFTIYLVAFIGLVLIVIWILQAVLLPVLFREYRSQKVMEAVDEIADSFGSPLFYRQTSQVAREQSACVRVLRENGTELFTVEYMPNCEIHTYDKGGLSELMDQAEENGGSFSAIYAMDSPRMQNLVPTGVDAILCVQVFTSADGGRFAVFFNTTITPVDGIVEVLTGVLKGVLIVTLLLSLVFARLVSLQTARPITKLNEQVRQLNASNYNVVFESNDYREVAELSDTLNTVRLEIQKLEGLRRELIAHVSHDLRTPLSMIIAYAEVMRDIPGENTPENVQVIIDEANRLSTLVEEVLVHPTRSDNLHELHYSTYDLAKTCRETIYRYQKMNSGADYQFRYDGPESAQVYADEVKIYQVVYNLLTNAMSHAGRAGAIVLRVIPLAREQKIKIEVSDQGVGIAANHLPMIWARYYSDTNDDTFHIGLGLTIVQTILECHGAPYGVESEEGKGSTFWFCLDFIDPASLKDQDRWL